MAVRSSIVNQQIVSMRHQALANAVLLRGEFRVPGADVDTMITTLDSGPNTGSLVYTTGSWFPSSAALSPQQLPQGLVTLVLGGSPEQQLIASKTGSELVVGVPIAPETAKSQFAAYFEIFDLADLVRTLHTLLCRPQPSQL